MRSRFGKKTARKLDYFVAFWWKDPLNKNLLFRSEASSKELAIVEKDTDYEGIFIISEDAAIKHWILTNETQREKMAMTIYPSWCQKLNETTKATQK
ncbi:MepB family protein [Fundicoccus sp. Sow4_F4]|uniref:MepB family protein n=1 Tax=Fundicoccus sp. Sow4_F4 TaxID=3438783 RepID=UPI003F91212B